MKKITALLLALLMLTAIFVACGDNGDTKEGDETQTEVTTDDGLYHADYLPDNDYDGYAIRSITTLKGDTGISESDTLFIEVDTPKKYDYEQYLAIERIKAKYGFTIEETYVENWSTCSATLRNYVDAADDAADLNMLIHREGFSLGVEHYLADYSTLPYCDTTQPWYVKSLNEAHTINGYCFFYYTYACLDAYGGANGIAFNKSIIEDEGLDSPYELASNMGSWTLEKMLDLAKSATHDLNNDGIYTEEDQVGIANAGDALYPTLWIGCGIKTIEEGDDGIPVYTAAGNEKLYNVLEDSVNGLIDGYILDTTLYDSADQRGTALRFFTTGKSLFYPTTIAGISNFGDMEDEYGMVPCPIYDDTQTEYCSRLGEAWTFMVPTTCSHLEEVSVFLEAYAVESTNYVIDAFYKETLQDRYSDEETKAWLDVIRDSVTLDLGDTIWQSNCRNQILNIVWSKNTDFASTLSSFERSLNRMILTYFDD